MTFGINSTIFQSISQFSIRNHHWGPFTVHVLRRADFWVIESYKVHTIIAVEAHTYTEFLLCQTLYNFLTYGHSFNPYNNTVRQVLLVFLFYRWRNWITEWYLVSCRLGFTQRQAISCIHALYHHILPPLNTHISPLNELNKWMMERSLHIAFNKSNCYIMDS